MRWEDDVKRGGRRLRGRPSRSSSATPCFSFRRHAEGPDFASPKLVEERSELIEPLGPNRVEAASSIASFGDQSRVSQHAKMLGDRRSRCSEVLRDFTGCPFLGANELEDGYSIWLGQCSKHRGTCRTCAHSPHCRQATLLRSGRPETAEPVVRTYVSSRCRPHATARVSRRGNCFATTVTVAHAMR